MRWVWTLLAVIVAALMFKLALSGRVYLSTSPPSIEGHVALRKLYSVVAFAAVGWIVRVSLAELRIPTSVATAVLVAAVFSGAIEIAQRVGGSNESFWWNLGDILCGVAGGVLALFLPTLRRPTRAVTQSLARAPRRR